MSVPSVSFTFSAFENALLLLKSLVTTTIPTENAIININGETRMTGIKTPLCSYQKHIAKSHSFFQQLNDFKKTIIQVAEGAFIKIFFRFIPFGF